MLQIMVQDFADGISSCNAPRVKSWSEGDQLRLQDEFTSGRPHCNGMEVLPLRSSSPAPCVVSSPFFWPGKWAAAGSAGAAGWLGSLEAGGAAEGVGEPCGRAELLEVAPGCWGCCSWEAGGQAGMPGYVHLWSQGPFL